MARSGYESSELKCEPEASASFDADGSVVSHSRDFGDDEGGSGETTSHKFKNAGTYTVVLTVTDDRGVTGTESKNFQVP